MRDQHLDPLECSYNLDKISYKSKNFKIYKMGLERNVVYNSSVPRTFTTIFLEILHTRQLSWGSAFYHWKTKIFKHMSTVDFIH